MRSRELISHQGRRIPLCTPGEFSEYAPDSNDTFIRIQKYHIYRIKIKINALMIQAIFVLKAGKGLPKNVFSFLKFKCNVNNFFLNMPSCGLTFLVKNK